MKTYGMIGCGMMGQEHIRNIALLDGAAVTAIYEPDAGMRRRITALLPDVRFHDTIEDLLRLADVNAWVIAGPNHCHAAQLELIHRLRPLPTLVEKPICISLQEAKSLQKVLAAFTCPVWTAMEYRYMPPISALIKEARHPEHLGRVVSMTIREHRFPFLEKVGHWNRFNRNTGGTLVEKCCHFFDLMRLVFRSEPTVIYATGGQDVNHLDERYNGETPDILDNAFVAVDFASGQRAMLELCMFAEGSRYQEEITLIGDKGKAECRVPGPGRFWDSRLGEPPVAQLIISPRHPPGPQTLPIPVDPTILAAGDHNGATFYQHERFLRVINGLQAVEVTPLDGIQAVLMGLAAQHSLQTRQAVVLQDFMQETVG